MLREAEPEKPPSAKYVVRQFALAVLIASRSRSALSSTSNSVPHTQATPLNTAVTTARNPTRASSNNRFNPQTTQRTLRCFCVFNATHLTSACASVDHDDDEEDEPTLRTGLKRVEKKASGARPPETASCQTQSQEDYPDVSTPEEDTPAALWKSTVKPAGRVHQELVYFR
jgi:hypothetical protein